MNLRNKKGEEFHVDIVGYQFPDIHNKYWDSNWLNIRVSGINSLGSWSVEDPSLLTFEVESLASWLEKLILDKVSQPREDFLEPNLKFCVIKHGFGSYLMRVDLCDVLLTDRVLEIFGDTRTVRLYFPLETVDLSHQAHLLREQLSNYPQRIFR